MLEDNGIYQIGRYGRWRFQGIVDWIRDGFAAGRSFRQFLLHEPARAGSLHVV
jgi:hypothetical protein